MRKIVKIRGYTQERVETTLLYAGTLSDRYGCMLMLSNKKI